MKAADVSLIAAVALLATFVATQATVQGEALGAAPVLADAAAQEGRIAGERTLDATRADDPSVAGDDAANDDLTGALRTGATEQRVTAFVSSVPREAALPAREMQRRLQQGASGTYIEALLAMRDSTLARWPDRLVAPLRVWIGDGSEHDDWDSTFPAAVREAFETWSATGIPVRFTFVRDSSDADVRVRFVPTFAEGISGRTIWSRDRDSWLVAGDIHLSLQHPRGDAISRPQLHAIALHEVGHLLGLDHVDDPVHIMAPRVRARTLSDGDIATVRLLYSVPAGSVRP